ncbi:MAG: hypothetical protein M1547_02530 [Gammaproteobacteria bacterium]|nr:hypothetical protein [Gammaproteobacteria bacterium]
MEKVVEPQRRRKHKPGTMGRAIRPIARRMKACMLAMLLLALRLRAFAVNELRFFQGIRNLARKA